MARKVKALDKNGEVRQNALFIEVIEDKISLFQKGVAQKEQKTAETLQQKIDRQEVAAVNRAERQIKTAANDARKRTNEIIRLRLKAGEITINENGEFVEEGVVVSREIASIDTGLYLAQTKIEETEIEEASVSLEAAPSLADISPEELLNLDADDDDDENIDENTGDDKEFTKNLVLPRFDEPGYELISYFSGYIKVYNALDTRKVKLTREQVDRIKYEYRYRLNAMLGLLTDPEEVDNQEAFLPIKGLELRMCKELQKELPGLAATIIDDVGKNSPWLNETFKFKDSETGHVFEVRTPKLPKFLPTRAEWSTTAVIMA